MWAAFEETGAVVALLYELWGALVADVCLGDPVPVRLYFVETVRLSVGGLFYTGGGADGVVAEGTHIETPRGACQAARIVLLCVW